MGRVRSDDHAAGEARVGRTRNPFPRNQQRIRYPRSGRAAHQARTRPRTRLWILASHLRERCLTASPAGPEARRRTWGSPRVAESPWMSVRVCGSCRLALRPPRGSPRPADGARHSARAPRSPSRPGSRQSREIRSSHPASHRSPLRRTACDSVAARRQGVEGDRPQQQAAGGPNLEAGVLLDVRDRTGRPRSARGARGEPTRCYGGGARRRV